MQRATKDSTQPGYRGTTVSDVVFHCGGGGYREALACRILADSDSPLAFDQGNAVKGNVTAVPRVTLLVTRCYQGGCAAYPVPG